MDNVNGSIYEKTFWDVFWLANGEKLSILNAIITVVVGLIKTLRGLHPVR